MLELNRSKDEKWIFQKNVSSKDIIKTYVETVKSLQNVSAREDIQKQLRSKDAYKGRSKDGSLSTLGVRFSQMCFYMFGYKSNDIFIPTKMTQNILDSENEMAKNMLVSLFSIQFPHPYSKTPSSFKIFAGRLIVKMLTEDRIENKLYIDEFIWFMPFLKKMDENIYEQLIQSILEYRQLSYDDKKALFNSVPNSVDIFANCMHECKYYFMRIFEGFKVFELIEDPTHNQGKLFSFKHGNTQTYRKDNIGKECSGYVKLVDNLKLDAKKLIERFSPFDVPTTMADNDIYSKQEWLTALYDIEPLKYLSTIMPSMRRQEEISTILNNMTRAAISGSVDGKEFENSLKPVLELFDKVINAEIISGSGDTDLLCVGENENSILFNFNVDGKSRSSSNNVNIQRLKKHMRIHNSKYCIVVAPRFPRGTIEDMEGERVVALCSEALAKYCSKECLSNRSGTADFNSLNNIINNNLGKDITSILNNLTEQRYGIALNQN